MGISDVLPAQYRLLGLLALTLLVAAVSAAGGWTVQGYRLGERLQEQGREHERRLAATELQQRAALAEIARAAAAQQQAEQDKRQVLEQRLQAQDETNHGKLTDAQNNASRLRDRLATTELRLSVLLDAGAAGGACGVPAATAAGGLVHGGPRAELDSAHAQRIVAITSDGDEGLIALKACQEYARGISGR